MLGFEKNLSVSKLLRLGLSKLVKDQSKKTKNTSLTFNRAASLIENLLFVTGKADALFEV